LQNAHVISAGGIVNEAMKAAPHPRQAERLAALRAYDILDTPRESDFDDIALLASKICGTPISVVNLIDADRQWFKAEVGLDARETPLDTSICSHVILEQDFTMIEDTHTDPRTADNALCAPADGLRFYAGALLKADNGLPIGTLCVLDTKPNSLDEDQKLALRVLARRVMRELDLRKAIRTHTILRDEMDHRVKNSLATVSGAVRLYRTEARKTGDPDASFDAIQRQLDAVAAVHQAIYRTDTAERLDLSEYMSTLAGHLRNSLPGNLTVVATAPDLPVLPKIANAIGLVANEFAANTVKHGALFATGSRISYDLSFRNGELTLTCSNNVPEIASHADLRHPGIGARIMKVSVEQFGGSLVQKAGADGFELVATIPIGEDLKG
jgi:two-component sensor histidine kinase